MLKILRISVTTFLADSACSLIQAARNLMNAVVLTVKASYVASRMYKPAAHHQVDYVVLTFKASYIPSRMYKPTVHHQVD